MKFSIASTLAVILLVQSASAWTFTWRGSDGVAHIHNGGEKDMACTGISHAKGQKFEWDRASGSKCCISLYADNVCPGDPQGLSCPDWTKESSSSLSSYKVTNC